MSLPCYLTHNPLRCRGFTHLHTWSPRRKILPFPKCWQLSNFRPVCPCWEHRKRALKRAAPKKDPSPPSPKVQFVALLWRSFASRCALRCPRCAHTVLSSRSWAPAGKKYHCKLFCIPLSPGPCSQLLKWNRETYPSLHWLWKYNLFWCWRLSVPGISVFSDLRDCFSINVHGLNSSISLALPKFCSSRGQSPYLRNSITKSICMKICPFSPPGKPNITPNFKIP